MGEACCTALETLAVLYDEGLIDNAARQGGYLLERLRGSVCLLVGSLLLARGVVRLVRDYLRTVQQWRPRVRGQHGLATLPPTARRC